jgi:hypothetical protein
VPLCYVICTHCLCSVFLIWLALTWRLRQFSRCNLWVTRLKSRGLICCKGKIFVLFSRRFRLSSIQLIMGGGTPLDLNRPELEANRSLLHSTYVNTTESFTSITHVGRHSSLDTATRYEMDGPGIESRLKRDFPHPSRPAPGPIHPPIQWVRGLFLVSTAVGVWR